MLRPATSITGRKTNPKNTHCLSAYDLPQRNIHQAIRQPMEPPA
jgi:hypothetical protein